jgi:uncharacterized spore protein YtfJ
MDVEKILNKARSALSAERVYGTPVERDGVTVIPAAKISGGGGGGGDESEDGGGGGGFGVHARPVGALIIEPGGKVRWKGIVDVNRIILGGQLVGIAFFFSVWLTERSKARAGMKAAIATAAIERVGRRRPD